MVAPKFTVPLNGQFKPWCLYQLRQLGWQGLLGFGLVIGSLAILFFMVYPTIQNTKNSDARILKMQQYVQQHPVVLKPAKKLNFEQQFYDLLPVHSEANRKVAQMLDAVEQVGLTVNNVEYSTQPYSDAMIKYQIKLPVQGTYIQVRQFINIVFEALPTVALNNVDFRRDDIGSDTIQTNLYFTLYLRKLAH